MTVPAVGRPDPTPGSTSEMFMAGGRVSLSAVPRRENRSSWRRKHLERRAYQACVTAGSKLSHHDKSLFV
jgi:hypothetical protein